MYNSKDKIQINPNDFALAILGGNTRKPDETDKRYIKRQLTLYLESLLLVQTFNGLEQTQFDIARTDQINKILEKVIETR